jgi:putative flippase GtrA
MLISTTSYCLIKIDEVFKDDPNKIDIGHNILFIVLSLIKSTGYIFLCFHMNQVSEWNNAIPIIISRYVAIGLSVYLLLIYKKHIVKSRE